MRSFQTIAVALISLLSVVLSSCASRDYVPDEYRRSLREDSNYRTKQTVVFFLVDGLSEKTMYSALPKMPNLQRHFKTKNGIYRAHAAFPSLTFPGVSSLLKERPVSDTGFIGNSFTREQLFINFEKPLHRNLFSQLMKKETIFSRLRKRGSKSVSLDYGLGVDATVSAPLEDFTTAFEINGANYFYADSKKLDTLKILLSENRIERWPEFIFVHLVGVDFLNHEHGATSQKAEEYFKALDDSLEPVFTLLERAERHQQVVTLLSSDHGFADDAKYYFPLESLMTKISTTIRVINETRMAAVYLDSPMQRDLAVSALLSSDGIEAVAEKSDNGFVIRTKTLKKQIRIQATNSCRGETFAISNLGGKWHCPSQFEVTEQAFLYPFLISNLAHYFQAEGSPDLAVIPNSKTVFTKTYQGNHGGPTPDEVIVPLLIRNARVSPGQIPPLWRILEFID